MYNVATESLSYWMGFPEAGSYCSSKVKASKLSWDPNDVESEHKRKGFFDNLDRALSLHMEGLNLDNLDLQTTQEYCFGSFKTAELVEQPQVSQGHKVEESAQESYGSNDTIPEKESVEDSPHSGRTREFSEGGLYEGQSGYCFENEDSRNQLKRQSMMSNASWISDSSVSMTERNNLYKTEL